MIEIHAAINLNLHNSGNSNQSFLLAVIKEPSESVYKLILSDNYIEINGKCTGIASYNTLDAFETLPEALGALPNAMQAAVDAVKDHVKKHGGNPDEVRGEIKRR